VQQSGCEIGQGLDAKQRQAAALVLNAPLERVFVTGTTSQLQTLSGLTGGSTTSEANVASVTLACEKIKARMDERLKAEPGKSWEERVKACSGLSLSDEGTYAGETTEHLRGTEGYTGYGCAISHVQYDSLLSEVRLLRAELVTDQGTSLNPGIDAGQVQGAYVMCLGYVLTEEYAYNEQGQLTTNGTWEYKVPTVSCVPEKFDVTFLANTPHPKGIFGSKASGEPATLAASSALSALRAAVAAIRADYGNHDPTVISAPATVEAVFNACNLDPSKFSF
jgi:xanthine dehydrogenase molybdopterin-binding subunit B